MTVAELIRRLQGLPQDAVVVLFEDAGFDPVNKTELVRLEERPPSSRWAGRYTFGEDSDGVQGVHLT